MYLPWFFFFFFFLVCVYLHEGFHVSILTCILPCKYTYMYTSLVVLVHKGCEFDPWVGKISWTRPWQPIPVFLPGKSHGQRSLVGYST